MAFESHEAYFASVQGEPLARLMAIQAQIEARFPMARRCISYQMPAYRDGRIFIYFAAFKKHIGIYPPVSEDTALIEALAPYRGPKGNLTFPHDQDLPLALIARVVSALHQEYARR